MCRKIQKGSNKVIAIDVLLTVIFGCIVIYGFFEIITTSSKGSYFLLIRLIVLFLVEVLLFIESLKLLRKNLKIWEKIRKDKKLKKAYIRKMKRINTGKRK